MVSLLLLLLLLLLRLLLLLLLLAKTIRFTKIFRRCPQDV